MKKNKAGKNALMAFVKSKISSPNELLLMKAIMDTELTSVMISDVKLSMSSLLKSNKRSK